MASQNVQDHYSGEDTGRGMAARILAALRAVNGSDAVVKALASSRDLGSLAAVRVWSLLWLFRDPRSGEVGLTRDDIASTIGLTPRRVSRILTALRQRQLLTTRRERLPRTRGPGQVIITIPPK